MEKLYTASKNHHTEEVENRSKVLNLIATVLEELWTEVHEMVQEAVLKNIPKKKNAKWLSEEALQIAEKRREAKGKREKDIPI